MTELYVRRADEWRARRNNAAIVGSNRLSGIHWAEFRDDSDEAAAWRGRPLDIVPVYTPIDTWANITEYFDYTITPYLGARSSTGLKMPALKQFNIFVPFVPTALSANYPQAFTDLRAGSFDTQWRKFGETLTRWQFPATIQVIPGWEFNGNWFPYNGNGLTPANWIATYKRVVEQIRIGYAAATPPAGITKVALKFGICVSHGNSPGITSGAQTTDYFPGLAWCDVWGLNIYDRYSPSYNEAQWTTNLTKFNGLNQHDAFVKSVSGLKLGVPEWGVWNRALSGETDPLAGGGDNPFYVDKMFQWFEAAGVVEESYFEHPSTPKHWISTARTQHNPLAGARYLALLPAGV